MGGREAMGMSGKVVSKQVNQNEHWVHKTKMSCGVLNSKRDEITIYNNNMQVGKGVNKVNVF